MMGKLALRKVKRVITFLILITSQGIRAMAYLLHLNIYIVNSLTFTDTPFNRNVSVSVSQFIFLRRMKWWGLRKYKWNEDMTISVVIARIFLNNCDGHILILSTFFNGHSLGHSLPGGLVRYVGWIRCAGSVQVLYLFRSAYPIPKIAFDRCGSPVGYFSASTECICVFYLAILDEIVTFTFA